MVGWSWARCLPVCLTCTESFTHLARTFVSLFREIKGEKFPPLTSDSVKSRVDELTISSKLWRCDVHPALDNTRAGPGQRSNVSRCSGKPETDSTVRWIMTWWAHLLQSLVCTKCPTIRWDLNDFTWLSSMQKLYLNWKYDTRMRPNFLINQMLNRVQ